MMKRITITIVAMSALVLAGCGGSPTDRAEKIQDALGETFSCEWAQENKDIPFYNCDEEGLMLMTGNDDEVETFVNEMRDSGAGGSAVIGEGYVVVTETKSPAEDVKETLGDDKADVVELGDGGGSGFNPGGSGPTNAPTN